MPLLTEKIMFEVYKDTGYTNEYRVVYFTELNDHNKGPEIARAMKGEHFCDGFLAAFTIADGKQVVVELLARLNRGESLSPAQFATAIEKFQPKALE